MNVKSYVLALTAMSAAAAMASPAAAQAAYASCQAQVGNYASDVNPKGRGDTEQSTGPVRCASTAAYTSALPNGRGGTTPYGGTSQAFADLSTGMVRVGNTYAIGGAGGSNGGALASWRDTLSVTTAVPLSAIMTVKFDGVVGPAGHFDVRLIVEGGNNVINDNISYRDSAFYGGSSFSSNLNGGSSYDGFGVLTVPISLSGGVTRLLIDLSADAVGNADFGHTVGLQFVVPNGVTYTSASGVFLSAPQDPISGGVTFDQRLSDFLPGGSGGVPEPASWALMVVGFGGAGAMLRRRGVRARIA